MLPHEKKRWENGGSLSGTVLNSPSVTAGYIGRPLVLDPCPEDKSGWIDPVHKSAKCFDFANRCETARTGYSPPAVVKANCKKTCRICDRHVVFELKVDNTLFNVKPYFLLIERPVYMDNTPLGVLPSATEWKEKNSLCT